jgi:hypothetical protein
MVKEGDAQVPQIVNTQETRSACRNSRAQCVEVHALTVQSLTRSLCTSLILQYTPVQSYFHQNIFAQVAMVAAV